MDCRVEAKSDNMVGNHTPLHQRQSPCRQAMNVLKPKLVHRKPFRIFPKHHATKVASQHPKRNETNAMLGTLKNRLFPVLQQIQAAQIPKIMKWRRSSSMASLANKILQPKFNNPWISYIFQLAEHSHAIFQRKEQ